MKVRLVTIATLATMCVILVGLGTPVSTHAFPNTSDFSFFDNTGPTPNEGIQCTALRPFEYHISVSNFLSTANVLRITYADMDFVRFKIAADGTQQLSGFARGGNTTSANQNFPDRCISICAETPGGLAGQMSVQTHTDTNPKIKCNNVTCGVGGVAPVCP